MTDVARRLMTADDFLLWELEQADKHELVDGVPVAKYGEAPELMANGRRRHAEIISNLVGALRGRLRGGPCSVLTDAFSVRTSIRRQRRPDVFVDCGPRAGDDLEARGPVALFEVLSPTSGRDDLLIKPEEYKRLETARHYVVVDQAQAVLKVWERGADGGWSERVIEGLEAMLPLAALGIELPLAEIYEDVELDDASGEAVG